MERKPLIACTTYRKTADQDPPVEILGLMPSYLEAVAAAGGVPIMIPLGLPEVDLSAIFERVDGILLPGGGDIDPLEYKGHSHDTLWGIDKDRDRVEMIVARTAVARRKPLLAICRGHQLLNVALGGTLWQDLDDQWNRDFRHDYFRVFPRNYLAHSVKVAVESKLAQALGGTDVQVNSLHHQGIRDLAPELTVSALAPDGLIEGVEVPGHPFAVGVQWHPENLIYDNPQMLSLFKALITAANQASANGNLQENVRQSDRRI